MAKKRYTPKNSEDDGLRPEERVAQKFAEQLIKRLEGAKLDWEKPWFHDVSMGAPCNFDGRRYNGMNQLFLALRQEEMGYQLPVWITFQRAKELGAQINKGEKSMTVWLGSRIIYDKDGNTISAGKYKVMSEDEQKQCTVRPFAKAFTVFNIQQTNYPELQPEAYTALKEKFMVRSVHDDTGMLQVAELDSLIENRTWLCPIEPKQQDQAFYSISKDSITVPLKAQFKNGESFYSTLLHEMAHSTGAEGRLDRLKSGNFGSREYAREELVAEMTAAIVANTMGFSSGIKDDSVAYLQSWLNSLKESPKFMLTVMKDVNKACSMIESHVYNKAAKLRIDDEMEQDIEDAVVVEEPDDKQVAETEKGQDNTVQDEPQLAMAVPESKPEYRVDNTDRVRVFGKQQTEPKLNTAYLGNGITVWEDGDTEYTGHISPDRRVRLYKEFTPANRQQIEKLAEYGNMTYTVDEKTRKLILEPLNMATHLLQNTVTGKMYPVSREHLKPDNPKSAVYCSEQSVLPDEVQDRLIEIKYPREYIFSITGMQNIRPVFYKLIKQGIDVSDMDSMLETTDDIIEKRAMGKNEIEDKVLYFHVKDNRIDKFNRLVDELGAELPRYWFHDNRLQYNQPGREARKNQSDAQILAGGESVVRVKGIDGFLPSLEALATKGVAILPKLEAEMQLMVTVSKDKTIDECKEATMYLFIKDGVVVDTEPNINEKDYDLPKFIYDGIDFQRWYGQQQSINNKEDWSYAVFHFQVQNRLATEADGRYTDNEKDAERIYNEMSVGDNNNQNVTMLVHISPAMKNRLMKPLTEQELMDIMNSNRSERKVLKSSKDITHQLNNKNMANKEKENMKEIKDGLYLFPMKSGDYGINEVKNGVATPTIRILKDAPELKEFFEAVKGKSKEVRNEEIKKLADKYLTPENIAAAEERKAKRTEKTANGETNERGFIRIPEVKPENRGRIANVRTFMMQDGKTMAVSADIDGAHMTRPMGEKLQNTFFAKAKGTTGDEKKELDIAVAAMTFRKELSEPKQEQGQSAGMKR